MRTRLRSFILLTLLPSFIISMRAQQAKSLGDVGRPTPEQKENANGAMLPRQPAGEAAQSAPVTQMQLFAWLAGGLNPHPARHRFRVCCGPVGLWTIAVLGRCSAT